MRLVGPVFVVVGVFFVYVGFRKLRLDRRLTGRAGGTVVGLVRGYVGRTDSTSMWFPMVRWADPAGRVSDFRGQLGSQPARYREGQPVVVAFDPAGALPPQLAGGGGGLGALFVGLGSLFALVGAGLSAVSLVL